MIFPESHRNPFVGVRAAAQIPRQGSALQNAGLSGDAARLRARRDMAGDQHFCEQASGVSNRTRSDRFGIAVVLLFQAAPWRAEHG
jgi:hypothetical protein